MARMNRRAKRAQDALNGGDYHEGSNDDPTAVVDLLADLRHFCDARGLDFADLDRISYNHYTEEPKHAKQKRSPIQRFGHAILDLRKGA